MTPTTTPELHRSGSRTLMLLGTHRRTRIWRDVTLQAAFANSKYMPHQGKQECARRLRQEQRILDKSAAHATRVWDRLVELQSRGARFC